MQEAQLRPVRGFDRLAVAGFSEADIANFRRQFHSQSNSNYLDMDFETEEECTKPQLVVQSEQVLTLMVQ